ncbi:MAG: 6,7-dimethyl-8-ribityllumazine synthase [Alphaproteobacteria bacterium]|nr:6,7-dimethyl-8-ribityllumazine synthase [Alphaproteobacteria bacterium]
MNHCDPYMTHPRILIVESRFHAQVADWLLRGARALLADAGAVHDTVQVPGALEIPAVISYARDDYDGFVALGCVMRGATYHFEVVANESARGLMDLMVQQGLAIGNGILTCETIEQALERADPARQDRGGAAAQAAMALVNLKARWAS